MHRVCVAGVERFINTLSHLALIYCFAEGSSRFKQLLNEGKGDDQIFHIGHVTVEDLLFEIERLEQEPPPTFRSDEMKTLRFGVITLHRPAAVGEGTNMLMCVITADIIAAANRVISGMHATTAKRRLRLWDGRAGERVLAVLEERL